jgi:hypothetical protein
MRIHIKTIQDTWVSARINGAKVRFRVTGTGPRMQRFTSSGPIQLSGIDGRRGAASQLNHRREHLVWPTTPRADLENLPELVQGGQAVFFETYRGFNIKRLQVQASHPVEMEVGVNSGAWCLRAGDAVHFRTLVQPAEIVFPAAAPARGHEADGGATAWNLGQPFIDTSQAGHRIHANSEQRLLSAAPQGGTDGELSDLLGVSLSAVKKVWASIYLRVQSVKPFDVRIELDKNIDGDRGKEKKQKLLVFLREHPEELRPYSQRLLQNGR